MIKARRFSRRKLIGNTVAIILLALSAILFVTSRYKNTHFHDAQIDEMIFYFTNGFVDGQTNSLFDAMMDNLFLTVIIFFLLLLPVIDFYRNRISIKLDLAFLGRKKGVIINPSHIPSKFKIGYALAVFALSLWLVVSSFGVVGYVKSLVNKSTLFEEKYVEPRTAKLIFPEKKRNLIYIYLESMENTLLSKKAGGQAGQSLIPELEALALDQKNVSFSHRQDALGGAMSSYGATWTVGSLTAQSAGLPLKVDVLGSDANGYGKYSRFLPGAYTLGDILHEQGYNQTFLMGSNASFGGRDKLLSQHGGYTIKDHQYMKKNGFVDPDYHVWWGFEDKKLIDFSKEEIVRLSKLDKPFNVQLLTVDTHFVDGWLDPSCDAKHKSQYDNVHACSSKMIGEFVTWVQQQPFAENTTVVITGDHVGMQTEYYNKMIGSKNYTRTTYNVFINSVVAPTKSSKGRMYTAYDMYPTTLASIGVVMPGNQLGLGVNLFSESQTLAELYGVEQFSEELQKRSDFYNTEIVKAL